ncbi:uncharacterized protein BDW43DRAFT_323445 [Aspergillus alliaceus]|uniref:uncharacterized protein n=1 Tax=Petromyces alliaceus TaxID=209559 RepID=UPI0012A51E00|nr:uncharacterized protein BDW43DRAFT_323445 [Aspergillus alliaceus]KAB8227908.1 hypothetical protein BDW43DRAFT_323445 [Aspergillus alliaceus]
MIFLWSGIKRWLWPARSGVQRDEIIIFADAERGPSDLVIIFLRGQFYDRLPWSEFKSIGTSATTAVVEAGWRCRALDWIAETIREKRFDEKELDKLRDEAKDKRKRISSYNSSDPVSVFERD